MKKILLLCFLTSGVFLFSQERNIQIISDGFIVSLENEEPIYFQNRKGEFDIIDYIQFTDASIPGSYKLPSKSILIAIPPYTNPEISLLSYNESILSKSIPRLNPALVTLNDSTVIENYNDLQYKPSKNSNKNSLEIVGYGWFREFYCVQVKIYTHYFNEIDNSIREIKDIRLKVKFDGKINYDFTNESEADELTRNVIYNHEISNQLRSNPVFNLQDTTGSWIDFTAEYLKIGTASDELFRVTKSDLESRGVNTSTINPRTFQLFQSGKEVEIIVSGEQDSVLNDDDYILFFGKRNYSRKDHRVINNPDQEYNEYLNRYTDTTFYFLTWGATYGKRIQNLNTASSTSDTLNYYKHFEHIEDNRVHFNAYNNEVENQFPNYNRNKSWYSSQTVWLYSGTTRNFSFNTSDLIQNKIAKFYFKGVSGGSNVTFNAHNISLRVNGELLDSVILDRYKQVLLQGSLISSQLLPTNNTLSVKNYINGTNPNFVVIDWYEIEYPSLLKLNNDVLIFEVYEDVNEAVRVIKIENAFVNDYIILKLSPVMKHFTNYQISNNSLTFIDTVKAGDKYLVADSANVQKPIFYYKKQFVNLRSVTRQKDYLAITHHKFLEGSQNYLTSIQSFYNVSTDLINVQDIFDEFSYGYITPHAIRLYLSVTFQNRISPKPSYINLIGDANYDYKDYIFEATGVKGGRNYVPSYGIPVSDNWFVVWNDSSVLLPQMKLGRIPVNEVSELDYYLAKVENNESKPFDEWNKRYLFFSGGINDSEIEFLKATNDDIINQWISPRPVSGNYTHFYKTVSPRTDFGPYTPNEIEAAISSGSLFISYIGHSGTATWDNSINETDQLFNDVDRNPLITDFGCSTNKYAEPDIICFGERFLFNSTGQALAYVGNSSLGFSSTAATASKYFYENLVADSISEVGNAHLFSKIKLFNQQGNSSVNRVFSFSNVILGDPAVRIKIPKLPNFKISSSDIILSSQIITDNLDSTEIKIALNNLGSAEAGMLELSIVHLFNSEEIENILLTVPVPSYSDTIIIWVSTQDKPGIHLLNIDIDPDDHISEIYENDNSLTYQFNVFSNSLRDFLTSRFENSSTKSLNILNPVTFNSGTFSIEFQVASDDSFSNPTTIISDADTFTTKIDLPILSTDERYFIRYRINSSELSFSGVKSFYNNYDVKFLLTDSLAFAKQKLNNLKWENDSVKIVPDTTIISVLSSGFYSGATCVIAKDGVNLLSNTFFAGMGIAVFDNISLEVDTVTWFQLFNQPANVEALASFIDSIPAGKIVVMGVADDARNNLSTHLKDAIKSLGSLMIDSLEFRGSWALIGWKGAPIGSVIEEVQPALPPQSIFLDTSFVFQGTSGFFSTDEIGPASYWKEIQIDEELLGDASSQYILHGKRLNGQIDSIRTLDFDNGMVDIRDIDADQYPHIILQGNFEASSDNESPILKRLSLDFNSVPELGTNYQVVSSTADTILIGEDVGLNFYVYNVGEVTADTFKIKVDVINDDNTHNTVFETMVDSIQSGVRKYYEVIHNTSAGTGDKTFLIDIDSDQEVTELFEDNNFYRVPFYVKQDTSKPTLTIAFDGVDILDGDYISPNPEIKIELSDQSLLPVTDTSAVKILLNNEPVYYADNQSTMSAEFNAENPKVVVTYKPELSDGEYLLKVFGQNSLGSMVDSAGVEKHFVVSNEVKLLNVYNYPNPTSGETYFTFKLTQIPDELKIKIYTIAGRLIKELSVPASDLSFDFNKIYWNGKDEDGDDLANGVYLYKMIIKAGDKTEDVIQKLAIVR